LASGKHTALEEFINHNSDGLGNPLPQEVCERFGFAVACVNDRIPDYNQDVLMAQKEARLQRRAETQRIRRAANRQNVSITLSHLEGKHLSPHRNSTIHLTTGALITHHWTGCWHYREQSEILKIMGLTKNSDFIRNRLEYLREHNPAKFDLIESQAVVLKSKVLAI
jgi:hypothetical protein